NVGKFLRNKFTGFQVGSKNAHLNMKVYNKSFEVDIRKSCNPLPFYTIEPLSDVWCIEFTFNRQYLKGMSLAFLDYPEVLFKNLSSLWQYATTNFVTLKSDEGDSNLS